MRPSMRLLSSLVLLLVVACAPRPLVTLPDANGEVAPDDAGAPDAGPRCGCEQWGNPRNLGAIEAPLVELSGLVASRTQPDVFFAHNDSGDSARFFALSATGRVLETYELPGATANDWEELTVMPCAAGSCLVIGDFGDNRRVRTDYALYVVAEPVVGQGGGTRNLSFERVPFEYPGGAKHNAEAMLAHPETGRVYVVTKPEVGTSEVYRFPLPLPTTGTAVLERVASLTVPSGSDRPLTGAAVNPCGTAVLLRLYNRLVELRLPAQETDFERIFAAEPVTVPSAQEPQGEAVTYGPDGRTYFTASEKLVDAPPLYLHQCR